MATVRASCPDCGDVEFTTKDTYVSISEPDGSGIYAFRCPGCRVTIIKSAETRTVDLLLSYGAEHRNREAMIKALPTGHDPGVGPITDDEQIDFHRILLYDSAWFQRACAASLEAESTGA